MDLEVLSCAAPDTSRRTTSAPNPDGGRVRGGVRPHGAGRYALLACYLLWGRQGLVRAFLFYLSISRLRLLRTWTLIGLRLACLGAVLVLALRSVSSLVKSLSSSVPREP